ncbi:hypothetical protein [Lactobacillus huangpiensis]|uniref:hypothetical protein n=1 Tax=Lactobacillus huangpiensis TaxID=2799571 RepID=UPI001CC37F23|nr:hypothetical protein [Lactobacillus huangpiensis]
MADETTNTTENKNWQDVANNLKKRIDNDSMFVQVGYKSCDGIDGADCEPMLLTRKYDHDVWPIVVSEPTGFNNPKYDWRTHQWFEQDATNNSYRLNEVEKAVKTLKQSDEQVTKDNNDIKDKLNTIVQGQADMLKLIGSATSPKAPATSDSTQNGGTTNA